MMSPKRILMLGISLMFLTLGAGLSIASGQWSICSEPATRMGAFLPIIRISPAQTASGNYATIYDCAD